MRTIVLLGEFENRLRAQTRLRCQVLTLLIFSFITVIRPDTAMAAKKLVDLKLSLSSKDRGVCPGSSLKLTVIGITKNGKETEAGKGFHSWKKYTVETELGKVHEGELRFPSDPAKTWGKTSEITVTRDDVGLTRKISVSPRYDCQYTAKFDGTSRGPGSAGEPGDFGGNPGESGGTGSDGDRGKDGADGPDVLAKVRLVNNPLDQQPVFKIEVSATERDSEVYVVAAKGGELTISADGGDGGDGGEGGPGGDGFGGVADEDSGVTLFEDANFEGESQRFTEDHDDLRFFSDVDDQEASSVQLDRGCTVVLYQDSDFEGVSTTLTSDESDLGTRNVGNDAVSSLKVSCRGDIDQGAGGQGGKGGTGGDGGNGGNGGSMTIDVHESARGMESELSSVLKLSNRGGAAGNGGDGGPGGQGFGSDAAGAQGANGEQGRPGSDGPPLQLPGS